MCYCVVMMGSDPLKVYIWKIESVFMDSFQSNLKDRKYWPVFIFSSPFYEAPNLALYLVVLVAALSSSQ